VSVSRWRLRPLTFLCESKPLVAFGTMPSADSATDWASMMPAEGSMLRPAAARSSARSRSVRSWVTWSARQRRTNP
jgi:hypothetical protein